MSEPDRVHVEALGINFVWHNLMSAGEATRAAETVLTSTDPRVLDAMQDALVRAGRLREERWDATGSPRRALGDFNPTRLVTEWQEATS